MKEEFKEGEIVLYQNGDNFELGEVKKVNDDKTAFVYYHKGKTAARTPFENLHKIQNLHSFDIQRKKCY